MAYEFDTTVLGGLPVTIEFDTTGYDNRDVGGGDANEVAEWSIVAVAGRVCKKTPSWIYSRLTRADEDRIYEECAEHVGGW